jgi:hypothetical protein
LRREPTDRPRWANGCSRPRAAQSGAERHRSDAPSRPELPGGAVSRRAETALGTAAPGVPEPVGVNPLEPVASWAFRPDRFAFVPRFRSTAQKRWRSGSACASPQKSTPPLMRSRVPSGLGGTGVEAQHHHAGSSRRRAVLAGSGASARSEAAGSARRFVGVPTGIGPVAVTAAWHDGRQWPWIGAAGRRSLRPVGTSRVWDGQAGGVCRRWTAVTRPVPVPLGRSGE